MKSIRNQLVVYLFVGVSVLEIGAGAGLFAYVQEMLEHSLDTALAAKAEVIADAVHMEDDGQPHLQPPMAGAPGSVNRGGVFFFQIWLPDGRTLARVGPPTSSTSLPRLDGRHRRFSDMVLPDGTSARATQILFYPQPDEDEFDSKPSSGLMANRPQLTLLVAHDRQSIDQPLAVLLTGLVFTIAVITAGIIAIVSFGVRRGLKPLHDLARHVGQIGPTTLDVRCATDNLPRELTTIVTKLNQLLERLQQAFERERRFSADIAHELRTPLAELRALCEVSLKWPDPAAISDVIGESLLISGQMEATVKSLLCLARAQSGLERPQPQAVDLAAIMSDIWPPLSRIADEKRLSVEQSIDPHIRLWTDPGMFSQVLRNLVANAVQHTPRGGLIQVRATPFNGNVQIVLGNTNAELEPSDLPHLCRPFWRKDAARTDRMSGGLGLALASEYCAVLGVTLDIRLLRPDFLEICLTILAAPPSPAAVSAELASAAAPV
jgi:two-component system sensor histidine kinase QseC